MSSSVGGRLEAVTSERSLFGPDYLRLAALVLVAVAVHAWLLTHTALTARDSLGFARQALCFETPAAAPPNDADKGGHPKNAIDLVRTAEHPPGYPLAILAVYKGLGLVSTAPVADRALVAAQLANALAAVLLVIPIYLIGRMLFGRNIGFAAALLFQVLPVPARITSDGLTEGVYLLSTTVAVALGVRAVMVPRISGFLLCGLATGTSYLVRPEGLMIAAGPGAVALWLGLLRRWPRDQAFGRITALVVGTCLVAVPYMVLIGKFTHKPAGNELLNPFAPPRPVYSGAQAATATTTTGPLFAEWWNDEKDSGKSKTVWGVQAVFKEVSKSANYAIWPLALFAILALRRRFAAEAGPWVLVIIAACNFLLLLYLATRVGYVSERHTVLLTLLACPFAAAGLPLLATGIGQIFPRVERLGVRVTAAGLLVALVVASLPFALKPMHPNRVGHKHAGHWLAANMKPDEALIDPFCWAAWYAGRTLYRPDGYNPPESRATYIVMENKAATPHSRLPVLPLAQEQAARPGARVVYHWPENVAAKDAIVHVVKIGED
ncbi:glycosyltransferase family 39 protein [Gemmata sp. G18]|uniref:Glycosyltransferase family 39 protein n=1 Tax=Gemmata palustris TaxID=2822762 RepID=A0ABS5BN12_9BACT|nr:glycosyltransferase family 39 protein [Gemmata palustris]MBP3955105.1 glycosyltransferase family 39 protein [Gemmata palustris]